MEIKEVLDILNQADNDTEYSKEIFKAYEEGKQDIEIINSKTGNRRDWLVIADIYNKGDYSQKFHLKNYLEFKLKNGLDETADFRKSCYRYFRNAALVLYTREVVFGESKEEIKLIFENVKKFYKDGGKINSYKGLRK